MATLKFKYVFWHKDFLFGWHNKELYRLPSNSGKRIFGLKKLEKIPVGNKEGYRVKCDKLSIDQLEARTIVIDKEIQKIKSKDVPFNE